MGRFKPLLPWPAETAATTLVDDAVTQLLGAGITQIVVVVGNRAGEIEWRLAGRPVTTVCNTRYREGKSLSVIAGVAALGPRAAGTIVLGVDQPRPSWLLRRLVASHLASRALISVPTYAGRWGHPPIFASSLRDRLLEVSEETQGLRLVVRSQFPHVRAVEMGSPIALLNINGPEEYAEGLRLIARDRAFRGDG